QAHVVLPRSDRWFTGVGTPRAGRTRPPRGRAGKERAPRTGTSRSGQPSCQWAVRRKGNRVKRGNEPTATCSTLNGAAPSGLNVSSGTKSSRTGFGKWGGAHFLMLKNSKKLTASGRNASENQEKKARRFSRLKACRDDARAWPARGAFPGAARGRHRPHR